MRDEAERKYHVRNVVVVVKDGTLDLSTVAVNIVTDRDTIKFNTGPRCHSISWIEFQHIANYPTAVSDGGYPSAWFPSITQPFFQRDLGLKKEVRVVRLTPPAAPWRNGAEIEYTQSNWRNSPHMYYSGRGRDGHFIDTCRSRWLLDGDSCVEDSVRGRELGNWDHSPGNYGYTVTVGDVACESEPCPVDPTATGKVYLLLHV